MPINQITTPIVANPNPYPDGQDTDNSPTVYMAGGTTQATATLIRDGISVISNVTASNGIRLPVMFPGRKIIVFPSTATQSLTVYPPTGGQINYGGVNTPVTIPARLPAVFIDLDRTGNWSFTAGSADGGGNLFFTDSAKANAYYTDSAYANRYVSNGTNNSQSNVWKSALANQSNVSPKLLGIGDSTTFGVGSNGGVGTDLKSNNWITKVRDLFITAGRSTQTNSIGGGGSATYESNLVNDPRISAGAGWVINGGAGAGSVGGAFFRNSNTTNPLTFTPTTPCDTFKLSYVTVAGNVGVFRANIISNGVPGAYTNIPTDGTGGLKGPVTLTAPLGNNVLNIEWVSGTPAYPSSIEAFDSSQKQLSIINAGWSGARSADWALNSFPWSPAFTVDFFAQNLSLIMLGINDWNGLGGAVTPAQYKTNMQVIINRAKLAGDVILMTPVPTRETQTTLAVQQQYINKLYELSSENALPLIDNWTFWGSWETRQPQGWYQDNVHPSALGYTQLSQYIFDRISNP